MSDRQSSLDQTLTSVISLLENEQTLKKVRSCLYKKLNIKEGRAEVRNDERMGKEERSKEQESRIKVQNLNKY